VSGARAVPASRTMGTRWSPDDRASWIDAPNRRRRNGRCTRRQRTHRSGSYGARFAMALRAMGGNETLRRATWRSGQDSHRTMQANVGAIATAVKSTRCYERCSDSHLEQACA
jgi:hypothetical protein